MNNKYSVGQVLYYIVQKNKTIVPVLVSEEITKKTLNGTKTSYMLQVGENKFIMIEDLTDPLYSSPEEVKSVLVNHITENITKLVNEAVNNARKWYSDKTGHVQVSVPSDPVIDVTEFVSNSEESAVVDLGDGTIGRVKFSPTRES